jgi:hypothetical protein
MSQFYELEHLFIFMCFMTPQIVDPTYMVSGQGIGLPIAGIRIAIQVNVPTVSTCVGLTLTRTKTSVKSRFVLSCVSLMVFILPMVTTDNQYRSLTTGPRLSFSYQDQRQLFFFQIR